MTASPKVAPSERGLKASDRVGRFTVKQALSQSASVSVYLAEHTILGFAAVLKIEAGTGALTNEATALALLHSPQVPVLYARGELDDGESKLNYLACEFIEGSSLNQTLRVRRRLESSLAMRMTLQLLSALGEAHRQGLVHGNVRPENILLAEPAHGVDRFVLQEFGGGRASLPPRSGVMTKVTTSRKYTSPEVRAGMAANPTSDLFALGCVLFEALSGEHPEWDAEGRLVRQLAEIVPAHPDLSRVVAKAIAMDPKVRFETAQDFATVLLALDVDEVVAFGVVEGTVLKGPADTVDTVDMTQPRVDIPLPESIRHRATSESRPELLSTRKPKVWVLSGDPGLDQPQTEVAIGMLLDRYEVTVLDAHQRELLQGRVSDVELPWVVVFGDLHTLVEEPILHEVRHRGETAHVLVSTHENVDMLSNSVNAAGLDAQLCVGIRPDALVSTIDAMVERVRGTRIQYDGLRLAVADAQFDLEQLHQTFERKSA
jgi:serine/threonine protein kinase